MKTENDLREALLALPHMRNPDQFYKSNEHTLRAIRACQCDSSPEVSGDMVGRCLFVSLEIERYLNALFIRDGVNGECITVEAPPYEGHSYNLVRLQTQIFIIDGSAAQFIHNTLIAFDGLFAFVGTKEKFKTVVEQCIQNTADYLCKEYGLGKTLVKIEERAKTDNNFSNRVSALIEACDKPVIFDRPYSRAWEHWARKPRLSRLSKKPLLQYRAIWELVLSCRWDRIERAMQRTALVQYG